MISTPLITHTSPANKVAPGGQVFLLQLRDELCKGTALGISGTAHQDHQRDVSLGASWVR